MTGLDFSLSPINKGKKKGVIRRKNKWINKDRNLIGRKSFNNTNNLSLVLPKYKNRMKRTKIIRKVGKSAHKNIITSSSPYEEYLPARFIDVNRNEITNSKTVENFNKKEPKQIELPSVYGLSPNLPINSSKPPRDKSEQKHLSFYGSGRKHKRGDTVQSSDSYNTKSGLNNHINFK